MERRLEPEILDQVGDETAALNLADLRRINRWTRAQARLLRQLQSNFGIQDHFIFLDIGAASGDTAVAVRSRFPQARPVSLDLMHRNLRAAPDPRVQADAFRLPFADGSIDVVHASLFLHHFNERDAKQLVREMFRVSRKLVIVQDLERSWLSYYFLPATQWLLGWNDVTVSDGMKSVAAGWKKQELMNLFQGLPGQLSVAWHFPSIRYFIALRRTG